MSKLTIAKNMIDNIRYSRIRFHDLLEVIISGSDASNNNDKEFCELHLTKFFEFCDKFDEFEKNNKRLVDFLNKYDSNSCAIKSQKYLAKINNLENDIIDMEHKQKYLCVVICDHLNSNHKHIRKDHGWSGCYDDFKQKII